MLIPGKSSFKRLRLLAIILITLIAAFFRLYQITQLPPGDGYDPAFYGVDALQILHGARPIFLTSNYGREVLFSYLVAACISVWGPTTLAIHMASAIAGILTVPVVYLLAEELFANESPSIRLGGSNFTAMMMAVSYWHLNWSRYGVRAILVPLFAAGTILYLWRGLRRQSKLDFIVCGLLLGFSLYTYPAARLLPVLVVAGFCIHALQRGAISRSNIVNLFLIASISLLIFAPLGFFSLKNPDAFENRFQQVFIFNPQQKGAENLRAFANQLVRTLLLFGFKGDLEPYSTIPGRPALNPFFAVLFWIGLVSCLIQKNKPRYKLVFTWWILLLIPATISTYAPSAKRAIGTLPAIAMMVAIGIINLWSIVRRWTSRISVFSGKMMKSVYAILLISGFIYSGIVTYRDYFIIWAANPNLFTHFEVGISMMGDYIQTLAPNERIYVSPDNPQHPGIRYHSLLRENVYGYNGRVCLVLPERTTTGTSYIIAPSKDKLSLERIQTHFPQGQIVHEGPLHYGEPYFRVFHIPEQNTAYIAPTHPISIRWDANIQITGFDLKKTEYHPDETISLNLYYMATEPVSLRYTAFIHLLGANNPDNGTPLWAQNDSEPCSACYPTSMWKTDEIVIDTVELYLPANIPVGTYSLATGFYYLPTMERIKVVEGDAADNVVTLSTISVSN